MICLDCEFFCMDKPQFRHPDIICAEIENDLRQRGRYTEEQIKQTLEQQRKALIERANTFYLDRHNMWRLKKFPGYFTWPMFSYYLYLYSNWEKGLLPEKGGAADQCAKTMEAINFISSLFVEKQRQEMEEATKKNKKGKSR